MLAVLAILVGLSLAQQQQRPPNSSTCDFYATSLYGSNTSTTQLQLVQGIVALAFGGAFNLSNVSSDITGILNPGTFQNLTVDLRPWFDGSIDSTNLNNQPVGIDWLDGGATDPLYKYLSGQTPKVVIANTTNEYRLFSHFFGAFSHIFGCTLPPPPLPSSGGSPLSLAYGHKFMNLNFTHLGHFINQLTRSAQHFGFSDQDGQTFSTQMNSLYNVRCAPPITVNPASGPQLLSLCQNPTCPLAEPNTDCAAYVNLTANGISGGSSSVIPSLSPTSSTPISTSASAPTSTTPSSAQTTAATATPSSSAALSSGAIVGIAVGSTAGLALLLSFVYFYARRQRPAKDAGPAEHVSESTYAPSAAKDPHASYTSNSETIAEMESPRFANSPAIGYIPHHSYSPQALSPAPVELSAHDQRGEWDRQDSETIIPDTISPDTVSPATVSPDTSSPNIINLERRQV